jgi:dolichol-phosphate mannosyltransferase
MMEPAAVFTSPQTAEAQQNAAQAEQGPRVATLAPLLSVVVPTRNEEGNVTPLCAHLAAALPAGDAEIIFVDDSDDATPEQVGVVAARMALPVRLIHRPPARRGDGLGGAVVEGIRAARGTWVCVMDGDLQHPPALIATMLATARTDGHDLVVASRFRPGGDARGLRPVRLLLSWLGRQGARVLFPGPLSAVSDPMSGFFLVRREAVDCDRLRPRGFKILVEILVRTPRLTVGEVGFHFGERLSGNSKAGAREATRYVAQLLSARFG